MRCFSTVCISACAVLATAQTPTPQFVPVADAHRWWLGAAFAPEVGYRTLFTTTENPFVVEIVGARNDREIPRFAYTTGAVIGFRIDHHWGLESGANYSVRGYQDEKIPVAQLTFGDQIDPRRGYVYTHDDAILDFEAIRFADRFAYVQIPLRITWTTGWGKWRSITGIGASADLLVSSSSTVVYYHDDRWREREHTDTRELFEPFCFTPFFSTGVERTLGQRWKLRVEPVVRYGVTPIINTPISGRLWNAGLNFGVLFGL